MNRLCVVLALALLLLVAQLSLAADPPPLVATHGKVTKVEKDSVTIQPRLPDGKFGKPVVLTVTGTTKVTTFTLRDQSSKPVAVQKETDVGDLRPNQVIAVIYTTIKDSHVLLSAVVQPLAEK